MTWPEIITPSAIQIIEAIIITEPQSPLRAEVDHAGCSAIRTRLDNEAYGLTKDRRKSTEVMHSIVPWTHAAIVAKSSAP